MIPYPVDHYRKEESVLGDAMGPKPGDLALFPTLHSLLPNPLEYPSFDGADHRLGPVRDSQLGDDVLHVDLDGTAADQQALGDLGVGLPLAQ